MLFGNYNYSKRMFSDINECENSPCQNGGRCTDSEGSFTCSCTDGWEGQVCDQGLSLCLSIDSHLI